MSLEINGLGLNPQAGTVKTAYTGSDTDFSDIMKKAAESSKIDLDGLFKTASEKYGVPLNLLKAVAKTESNFNPKATSACGAMGIMQLMPGTATGLGVTEPYDPEQNIMGGAKYLRQLLSRFDGNTTLAVAAYNAGPGNVIKYDGIPPFKETQKYVQTVMGYLGQNIDAGSVFSGVSNTALFSGADAPDDSELGTLLENALLSGGLDNDLSSLLGTLGNNPDDISSNIMTTVYQLQLQMLQDEDKDDSNVIV